MKNGILYIILMLGMTFLSACSQPAEETTTVEEVIENTEEMADDAANAVEETTEEVTETVEEEM
jgi:hypothetical protein